MSLSVSACHRQEVPEPADASLGPVDAAAEVSTTAAAPVILPTRRGPVMSKVNAMPADPSAATIDGWLAALAASEKEGFVPMSDLSELPDGARVERSSRDFTAKALSSEMDPWRAGVPVQRAVHRARASTPDLLRHRFRVEPYAVTVTETINYVRIDFESRAGWGTDEDAMAKAIGELAQRALHTQGVRSRGEAGDQPYAWSFSYATLHDGARFSTAPSVDVRPMWSWKDRADGGLQHGSPYFLLFRSLEMSMEGRFRRPMNPHRWFDGTCWKIYE
jgi:hypothetical protein